MINPLFFLPSSAHFAPPGPCGYNKAQTNVKGVYEMKKKITLHAMVLVGVMAAFVFAASYLQFKIPTPLGETRLHLGNVLCLLAGFLLGPWKGGMAAGLGSMFFDLFDPKYITSAPSTFINKFLMAMVCALVMRLFQRLKKDSLGHQVGFAVVAATAGQFTYIVLYLLKTFIEERFIMQYELGTVMVDVTTKLATSSANAVLAIVASVILFPILQKALAPVLQSR